MSNAPRGGFFGGAGSRVISSETFTSEIATPILAAFLFGLLAALGISLLALDSMVLGPGSWFVIVCVAISAAALAGVERLYWSNEDYWLIVLVIMGGVGALVAWLIYGLDLVRSVWPSHKFSRWLFGLPTWAKLWTQVALAFVLWGLTLAEMRLRIEILDPGWTRRFERDAALTGVKPNWPHKGPRFPTHDYDERIKDLERQVREAQVETREVVAVLKNGQTRSIAPFLPDSPLARQFYRDVAADPSRFSTQYAMEQGIGRTVFEKRIRDPFLDKGWCYWVNPERHQEGLKLRAGGYTMICALAK